MITTLLTFAEACALPNAKRLMFHGLTGPVNAVEVDGTFFIESDEAEAKAACSKTPELASEAAVAPKAAENSAARAVRVAAWVGGDEGVVEAEVVADLEGGLQVGEVVLVVDAHHIEQDCGVGDSAGEEPSVRVGRRGRACSEQEVSALLKGGVGEGGLRV